MAVTRFDLILYHGRLKHVRMKETARLAATAVSGRRPAEFVGGFLRISVAVEQHDYWKGLPTSGRLRRIQWNTRINQ